MNKKITLQEIIDAIVEKNGNTKVFTNNFVHELLNVIKEGLEKDKQVNISGLGIFKIIWVETQNRRNPKNGENIKVPAHNKIRFQPEKKMKIFVNRKFNHLKPEEIITNKENENKGDIMKKNDNVYGNDDVYTDHNKSVEDLMKNKSKKRFPFIPIFGSIIVILILFLLFLFLNKKDKKSDLPTSIKLEIVETNDTTDSENMKEPTIKDTETIYVETTIIHKVISGNTLWGLANKYYDNAPLWPNIYRKNIETIVKPDIIFTGMNIEIPILEGTGHNPTKQDSFNIAEGYYLSYLAYKRYDKKKASGFLRIAKRFNTTIENNMK